MYRHPDIVENGLPIVHIGKLMTMAKRSERERTAFGQRMLQARERAGLTQLQVRQALTLAQSTLSELEATALSSGRTVEFARLYGCDPQWLSTGEGSPGWTRPGTNAGSEPPKSGDFSDRHEVSDSDWARLQEIKDMEASPRLSRKLQELRAELAEARQEAEVLAESIYQRRIDAAKRRGGEHMGGMSGFGDLVDEQPKPPKGKK
jgi:transcriptional regulator with XRE-family HTH domain